MKSTKRRRPRIETPASPRSDRGLTFAGSSGRAAFARETLADLCLGDDMVASAAGRAIAAAGIWPLVCELAATWRVLPQALARCDAASGFDSALRARLRGAAVAHAMHSASMLRACAAVQALLAQAAVPSVAIKGIATIATLYGAASRRMVADVDLVIDGDRLDAARAALESAGFADVSPPFEAHVAAIGVSRYLHNYARTFVRDGIEIDLHWQLGPRPPAALEARRILERSVQARAENVDIRAAGPVEVALVAVHHALRNSFPASGTLKDAADLAAWWQRFGDAHGEALVAAASESGLASSLLALTEVIARRNAGEGVSRGSNVLRASIPQAGLREAEQLRAFIERNLRGAAPDDVTVEVLAPRIFVRSLVGPLLRRVRHRTKPPLDTLGEAPTVRRPLHERLAGRFARAGKIGRELLGFRRVASYRAVARAQSRFH